MIEDAGDGGKLIGCDLVQAAALGQPDRTGGSGSHSIPVASANVRWRSTPACPLRPPIPELETYLGASMSRWASRLRVLGHALPETGDHRSEERRAGKE